jgi:hypothetical protein
VFTKSNAGSFNYASISNVILKDETGAKALGGTVVVNSVSISGTDNASSTSKDNATYTKSSTVSLTFTATSTLSPITGYAISCDSGSTSGYFTTNSNFSATGKNLGSSITTADNYTLTETITVNLAGLSGTSCLTDYDNGTSGTAVTSGGGMDGSKTVYIAVQTAGSTESAANSDTIIVDETAPTISSFTLHRADNSSLTDNVTDTKIGYTLIYNDNNTEKGSTSVSTVTHYLVSDNNTTPLDNSTDWNTIKNADNSTDNYTFAAKANVFTLYAWVKDNASNISSVGSDNISLSIDDSSPVIRSITLYDTSSGNSTLTNAADNVTVQIVAEDNESRISHYSISDANDNNTNWIAFSSAANSISENITTSVLSSAVDGQVNLYVWVKNTQDNVSLAGTDTDNITLDDTKPSLSTTVSPKLTGTVANSADNTSYTNSLTVTLDNITDNVSTSWAYDNGSGVGYYFVSRIDNSSLAAPDNSSIWQTWDNLTLSLDNSSTWLAGSALNDNNSPGNKTIYIWVKDLANNVSDSTPISIFFDNVSPAWSSSTFYLRDNNTDNDTYDLVYFDNASHIRIIADNVTGSDNGSGNGSGITGYYFTDNATRGAALTDNTTLSDNSSVWSAAMPTTVTLDNTSDGVHTIYGYMKDAAGNISDNTSSQTITLDTNAPVIDNLTWDNGTGFQVSSTTFADNQTGNFTIYLYAHDNDSTDNFSSGWKDYFLQYELYGTDNTTRASSESITYTDDTVSGATFGSITDFTGVTTDNYSFDNASKLITFTALNPYITLSSSDMSAKVILWLRDNASNISDNKTWYFHANHGEAGASSL